MECHVSSYISSRAKADSKVQVCLDSHLEREKTWTQKISHVVQSDNILREINENDPDLPLKKQQRVAKSSLNESISTKWHNHVKTLAVQGRFLDLLATESTSYDWKGIAYNLPSKICKFLINSVSDTLNTRANLHRWGKSMSTKCKACGNYETLHHVLNHCSKFLQQGRYTWRHNNILQFISKTLKANTSDDVQIFCDLEGQKSTNTTVPTSCLVTNQIPDLCVYSKNEDQQSLTVIELTVPFELNAENAHKMKTEKYASLIADLEANNVFTNFITIEVGSRGYLNPKNMNSLKDILKICNSHISFKDIRNSISKLALISSFVIYHAKNEPSWNENIPLLSV